MAVEEKVETETAEETSLAYELAEIDKDFYAEPEVETEEIGETNEDNSGDTLEVEEEETNKEDDKEDNKAETKTDPKPVEEETKTDDVIVSDSDKINKLQAEINRLQGLIKPEKEEVKAEAEAEITNFMHEIEIDNLQNPETLNTLFHQVSDHAVKSSVSNILAQIPQIIEKQVQNTLTVRDYVSDFYEKNQDLSNVRNVVKVCAEQVIQEHADWDLEKIFQTAAERTRTSLGLKKQADAVQIPDASQVAFGKTAKGRNKQVKISALQQELDQIN